MFRFTYWSGLGLLLSTATASHADITIKMLEPIVEAKVDLVAQRMHVIVNGEQLHTWKISSGRSGYATPAGTFAPYRIHKMWHSRKYNNAPMPYSVFYDGGFAVHGTSAVGRLGRPASHGCVRLRTSNAKKFYELVRQYGQNRTQIQLTGAWPGHKRLVNRTTGQNRQTARSLQGSQRRSTRVRVRRGFGRVGN